MTSYSFNFHGLGNLTFAYEDAYLTPGFASHRLALRFRVSASWLDPEDHTHVEPILIVGDAWISTNGLRPLPGLHLLLIGARGFPNQEQIFIDVSDDELTALHEGTTGYNIQLNLKLKATLLSPHEGIHPVMDLHADLTIPRTRWHELLDGTGREVGVSIHIPSPLTDPVQAAATVTAETGASLSQAAARLREARIQLRDGKWELCVGTCRKVLENIKAMSKLPTESSLRGKAAQERTKVERWAVMFYDAFSMTSGAHHETAEITWDPIDAEAILGMTASLLREYSRTPAQTVPQ